MPPHVVDVIPFKERYSVTAAGAIALCVNQLAGVSKARTTVLGRAVSDPLEHGRLQVVRPFYGTWRLGAAYVMGFEALFYFEGVRRALRRMDADVIHVHNRPLLAVMLQRAFPATPVVLFLHNDPMSMKELRPPKSIAARLPELAGIVALSDWIRDRLYEAAPEARKARVRLIYNVVDCPAAHLPDDAMAARFDAKEKLALFVGRINGGKGALPFAEAMAPLLAEHPDWQAVAIGGFQMGTTSLADPTDYQRRFLAAAEAAGPRFRFLGPRPYEEVTDWMLRARILAIPSRHKEAFARVAVEGMFGGDALVICTKGGALPEIAPESAGALHIPEETADVLGPALRRLMADPADCRIRGETGRAHALTHYHPAAVGAAIDAFHDEIVAERRARQPS